MPLFIITLSRLIILNISLMQRTTTDYLAQHGQWMGYSAGMNRNAREQIRTIFLLITRKGQTFNIGQ